MPALVPTLRPEVLKRFPHDPAAFTQGLQWVEGRLLESTGQVGESGVRWVDPSTGQIEAQAPTPSPQAFGEGATFLNGQVYHITWQTGEAYRFDQALQLQETYAYQGEGWGLTHNGQELIMSDGSAALFFRDPHTFKVTHQITVTDGGQPVPQLNELEWADGAIWANVWMQDRIARIDPQTGNVTGWLDASALADEAARTASEQGRPLTRDDVLNGIAYNADTGTFFLTGKRWPVLFEVQVSGGE
ncbi:glutamine cyclotransferase [Deinococcus piscis]|uniref:Glutamine cyclotransferase n=2 Tax=Deinococcus piscis TaxID=394230 RepID=A0ABQ3JZE9_9DEIO|nr:glutamine cyclotransferase [Deinococcus piscis]